MEEYFCLFDFSLKSRGHMDPNVFYSDMYDFAIYSKTIILFQNIVFPKTSFVGCDKI